MKISQFWPSSPDYLPPESLALPKFAPMTGWYLSPQIRDSLIAMPVADRGFLVKELGEHGLTAGDLPDPHNAKEWVLAFDSQCMLRQIPERYVASWLGQSGFPVPSAGTTLPSGDSGRRGATPAPAVLSPSVSAGAGEILNVVAQLVADLSNKLEGLAADQQQMNRALRTEVAEARSSIIAEVVSRNAELRKAAIGIAAAGLLTSKRSDVQLQTAAMGAAALGEEEMPWEAFYCYNSADAGVVGTICDELARKELRGWRDRANLLPGDRFNEEIAGVIKKSSAAVIFLGSNGLGKFQELEIEAVFRGGLRRIVPCLLPGYSRPTPDDFQRSLEVRLLKEHHWIDYGDFPSLHARAKNSEDSEARAKAEELYDELLRSLINGVRKGRPEEMDPQEAPETANYPS